MNQRDQRHSNCPPKGLSSWSFVGLLATQFLGAMNDNMFRWFIVPIGIPILGSAEALSLGLVCFTVPYLLFATVAGYLADRFSKRHVIVACKVAEIVLMLLGVAAIQVGSIWLLFAVVSLMGCQSALFGPAKLGSIPEMLPSEKISSGNGLMGLVTVVASAIGTFAGYSLYAVTKPDLQHSGGLVEIWPAVVALIGVAVIGWLTSLLIARLPIADPDRQFPSNPITETYRNLRLLGRDLPLLRTALGIAFFWFLASLANVNINAFGIEILRVGETDIGTLMVVLVIGVGLGSVLAGVWSGGKVELGIVPLGAVGMTASSLMLFIAGSSVDPSIPASGHQAYWWTCFWLFTLGMSAGLFNIPLEAFLQDRSERQTRGIVLAASNFITFAFILVSAGLFYFLKRGLGLSPSEIFLVAGLGTVPVVVYIFRLLPQATLRFLVWLASHLVYRVRVFGRRNLPDSGGALIVANHVSWIDGILLLISSSRPIRMLVYADYTQGVCVGWLCRTFGVIPIKASAGPKSVLRSLKTAREAIRNGDLVCIFPEGQLTRTGQMQPFQRGMMRIIQGTDAPVIPTYLDELWGSIFSYHGGKFFWKWPARWPYPVSIHFGKPLQSPENVREVQQAVESLGADAISTRKQRQRNKSEQTAEVVQDGYNTGDIAKIDEEGFIEITGHENRCSRIGGEMVPHIKVEEELARILKDESSDELESTVVVTAVPDKKEGERLVVLHKPLSKPVAAILAELSETGMPNLWIPTADSFVEVDEIPLLGSGKPDLKNLKAKALQAFPSAKEDRSD